jgi:hypothetical protein
MEKVNGIFKLKEIKVYHVILSKIIVYLIKLLIITILEIF